MIQRVSVFGSFFLILFLLTSCWDGASKEPQLPSDPVEQLSFTPELSEVENRFLGYSLKYVYNNYEILFDEYNSLEVKELKTSENMQKLETFYTDTLQNTYTDQKEKFEDFYTKTITPHKIGLYYAHISKTGNLNTDATIPDTMKRYSWVLQHYPDVWNYTHSENAEKVERSEKIPFAYLPPEKKAEIYAFMEWGLLESGKKKWEKIFHTLFTYNERIEKEEDEGKRELLQQEKKEKQVEAEKEEEQRMQDFFTYEVKKMYPYLQENSADELYRYFSHGYSEIKRRIEEELQQKEEEELRSAPVENTIILEEEEEYHENSISIDENIEGQNYEITGQTVEDTMILFE